jgi:hypothetical protein
MEIRQILVLRAAPNSFRAFHQFASLQKAFEHIQKFSCGTVCAALAYTFWTSAHKSLDIDVLYGFRLNVTSNNL